MKQKRFTIEKKMVATVRYYETLYLVRDVKGERVFTGSEALATRIARLLNGDRARKRRR